MNMNVYVCMYTCMYICMSGALSLSLSLSVRACACYANRACTHTTTNTNTPTLCRTCAEQIASTREPSRHGRVINSPASISCCRMRSTSKCDAGSAPCPPRSQPSVSPLSSSSTPSALSPVQCTTCARKFVRDAGAVSDLTIAVAIVATAP